MIVPCTGRVDEVMMLRAFEKGADGVMVVGCLEGDCHYEKGNLRAKARVTRMAALLDIIGLGSFRLRMFNLSAGEGSKFAQFVNEYSLEIAEHGPCPINVLRSNKSASLENIKREE